MEEYQSDYPLTYISLFSGIGGFEVGILKIFPNAKCLGYSEILEDAIDVYEEHFPDHPALGDITKIDGEVFRGKVDLLVGGSPCQDFSSLGSGKGLKGKKSSLFKHYLRLLDEIDPKYFILENVRMKESDEKRISKLLGTEAVLIDSNIISCQRRQRLYWCNFYIPANISDQPKMNKCLGEILLHRGEIGDYPLIVRNLKKDKTKTGKLLKQIIKGYNDPYFRILRSSDSEAPTLHTSFDSHYYIYVSPDKVRQIHPVEMERLQRFPDNWTDVLSKTKRYKVLANAVTCDVIALIVSFLVLDLRHNSLGSY
jgi:site-specific DNA-cytosine methylase